MQRLAGLLVLALTAVLLAGCVYDPYTGTYRPCCGYYGYPYYRYPYCYGIRRRTTRTAIRPGPYAAAAGPAGRLSGSATLPHQPAVRRPVRGAAATPSGSRAAIRRPAAGPVRSASHELCPMPDAFALRLDRDAGRPLDRRGRASH